MNKMLYSDDSNKARIIRIQSVYERIVVHGARTMNNDTTIYARSNVYVFKDEYVYPHFDQSAHRFVSISGDSIPLYVCPMCVNLL